MEVILMQRVEKLGRMGDVVKVKPGYARNFLLRQGKALRATDANKARFESERAQLEAANLKERQEAEAVAAKMEGASVILVRQAGEAGQLYGSVKSRDVAEALDAAGHTIARSQIMLNTSIKTVGLFAVPLLLHPEVGVSVTVNVARSTEEAEIQAKTGQALVGQTDKPEETTAEAIEGVFEENHPERVRMDLTDAAEDSKIGEATSNDTRNKSDL